MSEENINTTPQATPAGGVATTPETNTTATANADQTQGTDTNKANVTATADTNVAATAKQAPKNDLPKGVKKELWELREQVRNLKAQVNAPVTSTPTPATTTEQAEKVNLLDDTDKWEANHTREVVKTAKKEILAEMEQAKEAERLQRENSEGIEYLLSKQEVSEDSDAKAEIAEILQRPDMAYIAAKYPAKAARLAYDEFISSKGVSPERKATVAANIAAAVTSNSTAAPMARKVWTRKEIETTLADFSNPKYAEIEAEIDRAIKERRVK